MSEFAEDMAALTEYKRQKKASNTKNSTKLLTAAGIAFTSLNGGTHLRLMVGNRPINFWPSTGLWRARGDFRNSRGVHNLIAFVKRQCHE